VLKIKYNKATNHIDGLNIRTTGGGQDMGDHVSDYSLNACGSLTRYRMADGPSFQNVADALKAARKLGGRKLCKMCEKAAEAMLAAATPLPTADTDNQGETEMPKTKTEAPEMTQEQLQEEILANIERVRSLAEADNEEGAAELVKDTKALIDAAKGGSSVETNKLRKELRAKLEEATKAQAAPSTEVAVREEAAPAKTTYHDIEGMDALVQQGADKIREGLQTMARGAEVARDVAVVLLEMRCNITDPKTGLPDLRADTADAKDASRDMFRLVEDSLKEAGMFNEKVFGTFKRSIRDQTQHMVVRYVESLDHNPDVVDEYFKLAIERNPGMKPTDAVRKECTIPEKSQIDKASERMAERHELARAKKALELAAAGADAEDLPMAPEDAQAIVEKTTVPPLDRSRAALNKVTNAYSAMLKTTGQLEGEELETFKSEITKWLESATVAKADLSKVL
jgi:hypothetical protein